MTETSARLALPLLVEGQAQKEMFHNEALARLDLLVQASAEGLGATVPPATPLPGQCWILGAVPQGAWAGHGGEVAGWTQGGWRFVAPREGMRLWLGEAAGFAAFSAGTWRSGEAHGRLLVDGAQVVGSRRPGIAEPNGGSTVDGEARAAIVAVLEALRGHGLIEPDGL
jgi:hypothetical protein